MDKQIPHSPEAEKGILGCILLSPNECLNQCLERLKSDSGAFYDLRHSTIYSELLAMFSERLPIDLITLMQRLKDKGVLEQIGGLAYLNEIQDSALSASNLPYWLAILEEKMLLRKMLNVCNQAIEDAYSCVGHVEDVLEEFERKALSIRPQKESSQDTKALVQAAITVIESKFQNGDSITGLSTGLQDLDKRTDGLHEGEMIVIAALPSCGKTALAVGMGTHNALKGIPVAIFTAEMAAVKVMVRAICSEARANFHRIDPAFDGPRLVSASAKLSASPLHIIQASGTTAGQLQAAARRLAQAHGIRLFIVDYIQLIAGSGDNREQQISSVSKAIKAIAMEHNCPVIALSQLNDDGKLRESRAIGQDADSVWKLANEGEWQHQVQPVNLTIEKCRDGETGLVKLTFLKTITRFECAAKIEPKDMP